MAEEHETEQGSEELENLSPEELQERIQEEKKNAKRSLRFAFTALIAIIAVCIAWFVANNRVNMTGTQISAENDRPFELASVGERQSEEETYLKDDDNNTILSAGTEEKYSKYIDINTGKEVTVEQTYHVGSSGLAWHMKGSESLVPGAFGELEFYLIPKKSGLTQAEISVDLEGYILNNETQKASKNTNEKISNLLNGHILFFQYRDAEYGYHGWIEPGSGITVKAPETEVNGTKVNEFQKGVPYKVTLFWKWPQYFRNYIYTDRSYGDLFTDKMKQADEASVYKKEYDSLIRFVNEQIRSEESKLFYDSNKGENSDSGYISSNINVDGMYASGDLREKYSSYYNQADEHIGKNIQYVYVQINVD